MRALVLTDDGPDLVTGYPTPIAASGEALISVRLAGICATDLEILRGYKHGFCGVLGHEFVGDVVAAPGAEAWEGRRVVGEINVGCGVCKLCRRGLNKHCEQRAVLGIWGLDGAFADYLKLPVQNLCPVPGNVPDHHAVFTEPLAAAVRVLEQIHITPACRVALLGAGRLGMLLAQLLALTGCELAVIDRNRAKLELLAAAGIGCTLRSGTPEHRALAPRSMDIAVEATGSPDGFEEARSLVRPGGTLLLKSTFAGALGDFDVSQLVVDEIRLVGSRCGPFPPALRLLQEGRVRVDGLISAEYALDDGLAALSQAAQKGVLKVFIRP